MRPKSETCGTAEQVVKDIRRATRKHHAAEEKIRIVLEGLRGEYGIAELCRREGIAESLYYSRSKEFLEAGKRRLNGDTERAASTPEVKVLLREVRDMKELVADLALENRMLKKHDRGWGRRGMRYPASEKAEIIRLVEQSHLPVCQTLQKLGIPRTTFYRWYDLWRLGGIDALEDHRPLPGHIWNRIPDSIRREIMGLALDVPELSPRKLAVRFTDEKRYFISESSV